jgi:hypothetical protein
MGETARLLFGNRAEDFKLEPSEPSFCVARGVDWISWLQSWHVMKCADAEAEAVSTALTDFVTTS